MVEFIGNIDFGNVPLWAVAVLSATTLVIAWWNGVLGRHNKPYLAIDQKLTLWEHDGKVDLCVDATITNPSKVAVKFNEVWFGVSENEAEAPFYVKEWPISLSPGEKITLQSRHEDVDEGLLVSYVRVPEQNPVLKINKPTYWQDGQYIVSNKRDQKGREL